MASLGRSSRLLFDLQACQTVGSAHRGVGRYSRALFDAICMQRDGHDVHVLTSRNLPHAVTDLPLSHDRVWRLPPLPDWHSARNYEGGERDALDALAFTAFAQRLNPDLVHVAHVFEGLGDRVPLPDPRHRAPGQIFAATLYDLIPLVFQDHYFSIPGLEPWYRARADWLRQADLLLAISESSRQDAIAFLGLEPSRIVTIHGGVAPHFVPTVDREAAILNLRERYGIKSRFVLYTGGDDHRKNLHAAIEGFASVPPDIRRNVQLVIVCSVSEPRKRELLDFARASRLAPDDVIITGFVPEDDLVAFYGTCELFVFPSLYEGLGLPVLEAMACGAPVVGGDNSSIREIIARPDALFRAESAQSIGSTIAAMLSDPARLDALREYGRDRTAQFTWEATARTAIQAFDDACARAQSQGAHVAIEGWLPRKRLAVLTPLPPSASGIADYNAQFLPYLRRHFDVDLYVDAPVDDKGLSAVTRIFDVRDFEAVALSYDAILYEFGNSSFHLHMLDLAVRFPGVVGLHDAYLSGLYRYAGSVAGDAGIYHAAMLEAHGPRARRLLCRAAGHDGNADEAAMIELPCTKGVIDSAIGVISHSPFNLETARANYPESWLAPYRTIPQMVVAMPPVDADQRARLRREHGVGENDFLVVSFGHVAWTKWGDRLLEAFLHSAMRNDPRARLVFAGELSKDLYGAELQRAIARSGCKDRVRITGYLAPRDYEAWLGMADLAVQLRTKSRGGTPKGVLDCMARRVPVLVNNDASYTDYPDGVVIKVAANPPIDAIAHVLDRARAAPEWRAQVANDGRAYVARHHDPAHCAAAYAAAIHEFVARRAQGVLHVWPDDFAAHLAGSKSPAEAEEAAAAWLEQLPAPSFRRRRLFIDVSHIAQSDHRTGIPRVVKQIVRALYCTTRTGLEPVAVELKGGRLEVATQWLAGQELLLPHETTMSNVPIAFAPGDIMLMLDSSWARYGEFHPVFAQARSAHVPIVTVVYDLLPITLSPGNIVEGGKEWFEGWIRDAVRQSNALVCISRTMAEQVIAYLEEHELAHPGLAVGYWHLGSDFARPGSQAGIPQRVHALGPQPCLLMVGTIEPRKCHALALDAMEALWTRGYPLRLAIAGKEGWMVEGLMARLRQHPELGKRLLLVEEPSDAEVAALYDQACGLLFLSRGEGFGLPLVEAARHGVPIVCSDLAVFHEVANCFATYVSDSDAALLADQLAGWWARREAGAVPDTSQMPRLTWEESAEALLKTVVDGGWIWRRA